jgi:flagella basal body P-ring formation protein FlgA
LRSCRKFAAPALCLLALQAEAATPAPVIELAAEATVSDRVYLLADVAVISAEGELRDRLAAVELGRTPRPGYWADITRHEISARIERSLPGVSAGIGWSGEELVRIFAAGVAQSASDIAEFARGRLIDELRGRFAGVDAQQIGEPQDLVLPAGRLTLRARGLGDAAPAKRQAVWVDLEIDGNHYQSLPIWFRVTALADVVTAVRDLGHHDVIAAHDLATATVDVTNIAGTPVLDPAAVTGQRLLKPLRAGNVFIDGMVEPAPTVQEGQVVEVHASSGRVVLRVAAIALADGDMHDRVPVRNPSSGERFFATVVGPGHVRVN